LRNDVEKEKSNGKGMERGWNARRYWEKNKKTENCEGPWGERRKAKNCRLKNVRDGKKQRKRDDIGKENGGLKTEGGKGLRDNVGKREGYKQRGDCTVILGKEKIIAQCC